MLAIVHIRDNPPLVFGKSETRGGLSRGIPLIRFVGCLLNPDNLLPKPETGCEKILITRVRGKAYIVKASATMKSA